MDITSLIITFVGIIIILAIYIITRLSRTKLPQEKDTKLPVLKNDDGTTFTSVLDDIPATDGSTPIISKAAPKDAIEDVEDISTHQEKTETKPVEKKQHILFISANDEMGLDGNLVKKILIKNGLSFGDLDIYHYLIDVKPAIQTTSQPSKGTEKVSLFRIANGVAPWTLKNEDLHNKKIAGLSIVLDTPCEIDSKEAIKTFVAVSHNISVELDGVLKNQQQQIFTPKDEIQLINSL